MKDRGFLLIEVLMSLVLLGIISVVCFPILSSSLKNMKLVKTKMDMVYVAESTMEQIKSFDDNFTEDDEYLFDIPIRELIYTLKEEKPSSITLPLDEKDDRFSYVCTIYKENLNKSLWKVSVEVSHLKKDDRINNVKVVAIMPIP